MTIPKSSSRSAIFVFFSVFSFVSFALTASSQAEPQVTVESGILEGESEYGLQIFRGVPYAAAPIGGLRWRAPRRPQTWQGIRDVTDFGPACPQTATKEITDSVMSENCLTLNIWSPAKSAKDRLPVMVWIHGGDFKSGSARMSVYDGARLAQQGVIIVSINYRLGSLGFFGHPQLTSEARQENAPTANFGLLDQIAALQWVKRNIEVFGGDFSNVTIFGESAGGVSVLALMTSPLAQGLFHKAIAQSGGGRWVAPTLTASSDKWLSAHECGIRAARALGANSGDPLAELRTKSWQEMRDTLEAIPALEDQSPFIDGVALVDQMEPVFARGDQAHVPLIVGANSYEGVYLRGAFKVRNEVVFAAVRPILVALTELYPTQALMNEDRLADYIWGDANFVEPARMIARYSSRTGQPVYHYSFDFLPPLFRVFITGAPHGLDVVYVFGNFYSGVSFPMFQFLDPRNRKISEIMGASWTHFAKTGDPEVPGLVGWPRFKEGNEQTYVFGNEGQSVERDHLKERLDVFHGTIW